MTTTGATNAERDAERQGEAGENGGDQEWNITRNIALFESRQIGNIVALKGDFDVGKVLFGVGRTEQIARPTNAVARRVVGSKEGRHCCEAAVVAKDAALIDALFARAGARFFGEAGKRGQSAAHFGNHRLRKNRAAARKQQQKTNRNRSSHH